MSDAAAAERIRNARKGQDPGQSARLDDVTERIRVHPKYLELRRKRNLFGW